jgi:hypothetical protein
MGMSLMTITTNGVRRQTINPSFPDSLSPDISDSGKSTVSAKRKTESANLLNPQEISFLAKLPNDRSPNLMAKKASKRFPKTASQKRM